MHNKKIMVKCPYCRTVINVNIRNFEKHVASIHPLYLKEVKSVFDYKEPILREVAIAMLRYPPSAVGKDEKFSFNESVDMDFKLPIATYILQTMQYTNHILARDVPSAVYYKLIKKIAAKIPESPRWKQPLLSKEALNNLLNSRFEKLTHEDFEMLNTHERLSIGQVLVYGQLLKSRGSKNSEKAFNKYFIELGIKDIPTYSRATMHSNEFYRDYTAGPKQPMMLEEVENYAKELGIKLEKLIMTREYLLKMRLTDLPSSFVPFIFVVGDGEYYPELRLSYVNRLEGLCYSLPEAKEMIINSSYKGHFFEDLIGDLLRGKILIEHIKSIHDDAITLNFLYKKPISPKNEIVEYFYRDPEKIFGLRPKIRELTPALRNFLYDIEKRKNDEIVDLLLVHDREPKHILVGECKYTKRYNEEEYENGIHSLKKLVIALEKIEDVKQDLGIPLDYPVVPVLFTSFIGEIYKKKDNVFKATLTPILHGKLIGGIANFLNH